MYNQLTDVRTKCIVVISYNITRKYITVLKRKKLQCLLKPVGQHVYIGAQVLPEKENVTYAGLFLNPPKKTSERTYLIREC